VSRELRGAGECLADDARVAEADAAALAVQKAGERARGAVLYVNLEPCSHYGRTPPCTEALIAAGIAEVHMAMLDPNPLVNGQGRARLEEAGIRTAVGACQAEARELNEAFVTYITAGRPFVTAKFAASLDGKIATRTGESRWISSPDARRRAHELRDTVDAILVGAETIITDDPLLTTRLPDRQGHHPLRVIADSRGRVPLEARVLDPTLPGRTVIAATATLAAEQRAGLSRRGIEILALPADERGRVDLRALLEELGRREVTSLLVEGGGTILEAFFRARLVDRVLAFIAPRIIGGQEAPSAVAGEGVAHLVDAPHLERMRVEVVGGDLLISGYPRWGDAESAQEPAKQLQG